MYTICCSIFTDPIDNLILEAIDNHEEQLIPDFFDEMNAHLDEVDVEIPTFEPSMPLINDANEIVIDNNDFAVEAGHISSDHSSYDDIDI